MTDSEVVKCDRPFVPIAFLGLLLTLALVALWGPSPASAAKGKPNLVVSKVSAPGTVDAGKSLSVSATVKNSGRKAAPASITGFFLSLDRKFGGDVRLAPTSKVKRLKPKKSLSRKVSVSIPAETAAGAYYLIACADTKKKVRETNEKDNCRTAAKVVQVRTSGPTGPTGPTGSTGPTGPTGPTSIASGKLTVDPATFDFGTTRIGRSSEQKSFTVSNTGTAPLPAMSAATVTGDSSFKLIGDGCVGQVLAAGSSCNVTLGFSPTSAGTKTGSLALSAGSGEALHSVASSLSGNAPNPAPAHLTTDPLSVNYGTIPQGVTTENKTLTITNEGDLESVPLNAPELFDNTGAGWAITAENCGGRKLDGGESCTIAVNVTPTRVGNLGASLEVTFGSGDLLFRYFLNGTGEVALTVWQLPGGLDFGSTDIDATSGTRSIAVTNPSSYDMTNFSGTITGPDASQFAIQSTTCGSVLNNHQSCGFQVYFKPTSGGLKTADLTISSTPGGTVKVPLTGVAPYISATPKERWFEALSSQTSATESFTFTNLGAATTGTLSSQLTGTDSSQFEIVNNGCAGVTLATGATCAVTVKFAPVGSPGWKSAGLTVSGTPGGTQTASLNGKILKPATFTVVDPPGGSHQFPSIAGPNGEKVQSFLLRNTGEVTSGAISLALLSENVPGQFTLSPGECGGITLAPNVGCFFWVRFAPNQIGNFSATVNITAPNSVTGSLALTGEGT